ncbi:predicted protein [Plenodomus lingam JN3]|uniref:Predicted protein n=1 Tax=Leptosphaeria maculans (strain JN3 / isolate v23.1.3 / race Av1-4-5-6-7-8) TaxID=985895 RepID=E5R5E4_LEPMJ|nr:predicted protein [Plenodomus lingam JN3]CBX92114.1 predicted protein [Plenodomus lingam JN3]
MDVQYVLIDWSIGASVEEQPLWHLSVRSSTFLANSTSPAHANRQASKHPNPSPSLSRTNYHTVHMLRYKESSYIISYYLLLPALMFKSPILIPTTSYPAQTKPLNHTTMAT